MILLYSVQLQTMFLKDSLLQFLAAEMELASYKLIH